ncbi:MAG: NAD-dependent dehydratase [Alphaproteobacteria bacterium 16-39-46]|nr:MAG: NAD-dependent dehydratase [Alphaproteobacteria bacterium 16-39-46]OZA44520.1 MAG: NAD-dependent dehydratase [Alphaproteobacteria bacterium 17-39-52]HQS83367.1 NAD-dependent epimerase/dehydratase family protein [Alphaproteobacteria bacterium]HQS93054.1 NAD-dependent epimerase/dehydratase family protein [Alphaproteobacteria bacterium]
MDLRGKKLTVVGGAGLIGSHTVDELLKEDIKELIIYDNFVRGTQDNLEAALKDSRVRIFEIGGDICQTDILNEALKGADGVFHFAALWLLQCHDFPRSAFHVNVEGTFNVLEACVNQGVKRLVYSSSASVYGDAVRDPMDENHPFNNTNFYGATKIAGEAMARAYFHRYKLPFVGLRYMNVYGPRQDYRGAYIAVIMKMLDNLDKGIAPTLYGDGSQAYDFVYVGDCAKANVCAMKADTVDHFYNVGTGIRTSIKELADIVLKITASDLAVQYEPAGLTFVKNRIGCPKKAEAEIGFKASVLLEEGLKKLIEWRKNHVDQVEIRRKKVM